MLRDNFSKRTNGLVLTITSDQTGQKFFKCFSCYHLLTNEQIEQIYGEKQYRNLAKQAEIRSQKYTHLKQNFLLSIKFCMLCDSSSQIRSSHKIHLFCKKCWHGVINYYNQEIGCLDPNCPYFSKGLENKMKRWIYGLESPKSRLEQERNQLNQQQDEGKYAQESKMKKNCGFCGTEFYQWRLSSCQMQCNGDICKKCMAQLYRQQEPKACLICQQMVNPKEIISFLKRY